MTPIETLARTAAQRAWAEHRGQVARVPRYPALPAWMALAASLRREGRSERLNRDAHRLYLTTYQDELDQFAGNAR